MSWCLVFFFKAYGNKHLKRKNDGNLLKYSSVEDDFVFVA